MVRQRHWILLAAALAACARPVAPPQKPREAELELRIAELERLLEGQNRAPLPAAPVSDARFEAVEERLVSVVESLNKLGAPVPASGAAPAPAQPAAPEPTPAADPPKLIVAPDPAVAQKPWTPSERKVGKKLRAKFTAPQEPKSNKEGGRLLGKPLPQRRFIGPDGDVLDLDEFIGRKKVVLVIMRGFFGQVCLGCSTQTLGLAQAASRFEAKGAQPIIVYPGEASGVPAFLAAIRDLQKDFALPYPILLDVNLGAVKTFGIEGELARPTSLIIDEAGIVRYAYIGARPDDRPSSEALLAELDRI